jgi:hypothetical protein
MKGCSYLACVNTALVLLFVNLARRSLRRCRAATMSMMKFQRKTQQPLPATTLLCTSPRSYASNTRMKRWKPTQIPVIAVPDTTLHKYG